MNDVFNYIWGFLFSSLVVRKEMEKKQTPKKLIISRADDMGFLTLTVMM
jgi:hypothetical protein